MKHKTIARKEVFGLVMTPIVKLTRRQLYDEIWQISVAGFAKKYSIPYVELMKQVKAANIPIPPSGYWTKLAYGKPITIIELTEPFDEVISIFDVALTTHKPKLNEISTPEVAPALPQEVDETTDSVTPPQNEPAISEEPESVVPADQEHETVEQFGQAYNVYNREVLYKPV